MNTLIYKIALLLLLFSTGGFAQEIFRKSATYVHRYSVSESLDIELSNKHGAIKVNIWEKDSVRIEVKVLFEAKKETDLQALTNMITFNNRQAGHYIIAETEWGKNQGQWQKTTFGVKQIFKENQRIEVEYTVYAPEYSEFFISNKFGDLFLPDLKMPVSCNVSHGNIRARNLPAAKKITVRYGKLKASKLGNCEIIADYSEVQLDEIGTLKLQSKSSKINIAQTQELNVDSKNDNLQFDRIKRINGAISGSDLLVDDLAEKIDLQTKYGSVQINEMEESFKSLNLFGSYTDCTLAFHPNSAFKFNLIIEDSKGFSFPEENCKILSDNLVDKTRTIDGQWGKSTGVQKVKINAKNAFIKFSKAGN